jgi:hypothetical protein
MLARLALYHLSHSASPFFVLRAYKFNYSEEYLVITFSEIRMKEYPKSPNRGWLQMWEGVVPAALLFQCFCEREH